MQGRDSWIKNERLAQLAVIGMLLVGCWLVLAPFFTAIVFATVVSVSTWPAYDWLLHRLKGYHVLASLLATTAVMVLAVAPLGLLLVSLADGLQLLAGRLEPLTDQLPALPPDWVRGLPLIGNELARWWTDAVSGKTPLGDLLVHVAGPARTLALAGGKQAGNALLQVALLIFLLFFIYRHGDALAGDTIRAAERAGGPYARELLEIARRSVIGVMFGIVGAGLAQAMVATAGFAVVGLPKPFLFGALTFVLSLVAFGPPLLWGGVALWLLRDGQAGWAVFMALYGFFAISSVDNLLKPLIISHANRMPFAWTLMGVIGGLFAFGITGVFLGPALLAVTANLARHWLAASADRSANHSSR